MDTNKGCVVVFTLIVFVPIWLFVMFSPGWPSQDFEIRLYGGLTEYHVKCPVDVKVDDDIIGTFVSSKDLFTVETTWWRSPAITATRKTPDGEVDVPVHRYKDENIYRVRIWPFEVHVLYIDNRRKPAQTLACGQFEIDLDADSTKIISMPAPKKVENSLLILNGRRISTLATGKSVIYLIDTSGERSYESTALLYGPWPPGSHRSRRGYRSKYAHKLREHVDYFLEPAPSSIPSLIADGMAERILLYEGGY